MKIFPIIPIGLMLIISIIYILIIKIKRKKINVRQLFIIILLFIINLRISIPIDNATISTNNLDVLFVIDSTISMLAEDYNGNQTRLSAVKKDCEYIINNLNGARFSIITFNNTSQILSPFTYDTNNIKSILNIIKPIDKIYAKGSSLNEPHDNILKSLKSVQKDTDRVKILFFISDGEITDDSKLESYSKINNYIKNGAVLGYGTSKGGYMKDENYYDLENSYIMDTTNNKFEKAISKIEESNLQSIAKDLKVEYIHMEEQNKIDSKLKEIKKEISSQESNENQSSYEDTYYILVIPLTILLILEYCKYKRSEY